MNALSISTIREALRFGDEQGYSLFKEIRDPEHIKKAKEHPITKIMVQDINSLVNQLEKQEQERLTFRKFVEYLENGNRLNYENIYFKSKNDLHALVIAEVLEGQGRYLEVIEEMLWEWCNTYSWELPAHVPLTKEEILKQGIEADQVVALFSAETGFYFAEILSLFKDKMHPLLVHRLEREIDRRILEPYKGRNYHWEESKMNWASVCAGSVGCTAIYQIQNVEELAGIVHRVIGTMASYLSGFDSEGLTTEGLGYWQYGFSFYLYFAELLRERTGGKINLLAEDDKIYEIAKLPMYLQFPDMHMVNFSDAPGDKWFGEYGLLTRLEQIFDISGYNYPQDIQIFRDHTSKWALLSRNVFWTVSKEKFKQTSSKSEVRYFKESQWLIDRSYTDEGEFVCFAAKGGHNDEPHNHNDLGHFILHYSKETLLCDLGAPEYTKAFFGPERYSILHASSLGHSVPIINGQGQSAGARYRAEGVEIQLSEKTCLSLNLTGAYKAEGLIDYNRQFVWDKQGLCLNIKDSFNSTNEQNRVEEVFITQHEVEVIEDAIVIRGEKNQLEITSLQESTKVIEKIKYINHFGKQQSVNRIKLIYTLGKGQSQITLDVKITG